MTFLGDWLGKHEAVLPVVSSGLWSHREPVAPLGLPSSGAVHVWHVPIPSSPGSVVPVLTHLELQRARDFVSPDAKIQFIATRSALRVLLSRYLGLPPLKIELRLGLSGKPRLGVAHDTRLHFSVSHARGLALCAFAWEQEVGVDVEAHLEAATLQRVAERICSPQELQRLRLAPEAERVPAFYRCWTKKEALVKAVGEGLSLPVLPLLDVLSLPGSVELRGVVPALAGSRWQLEELEVGPSHSAAVALRGAGTRIISFISGRH